ncbi:MAG: hypothetical protein Q8L29_01740 [archaeon]|nr:hypothetical protein [archaeon]
MHQINGNERTKERNELYYIYFCRKLSPNDRAPEYGLLIDEKERKRVIGVLEKEYSHNRIIYMSAVIWYLHFLIEGVSVIIPRDSKEQRDYVVMVLSSEEILPMGGLVERLGLPFRECVLMRGEENLFKTKNIR